MTMYLAIILWYCASIFVQCGRCKEVNFCEFHDAKLDASFNFTSLSENTEDYVIKHESTNETIRLQLCRSLQKNCNGSPGHGACLVSGNEEKSLGTIPEVIREDGRIIFKFTGDVCKINNNSYSLNVIMLCDYEDINFYPELFPYSKGQCDFFIAWRTKLACRHLPKLAVISPNCSVNDDAGNLYDLNSLKRLSDNYVVHIDKKTMVILNVCHPVVYGYRATCLERTGACLRSESGDVTYTDIGMVNDGPTFIGKNLTLKYGPGIRCPNFATKHFQTTISFTCDINAHHTSPVYVGGKDNCQYNFEWKTAAACNEKELEFFSSATSGSCKVTNPVTSQEYDLSSLKGQDYIVQPVDGAQHKASVCEPLTSNSCRNEDSKGEAGVCSAANKSVGGKANAKLLWSSEYGVYLNYTNGSECENNGHRYTVISFRCRSNNFAPVVVEDTSCHLFIRWYTPLVCEKKNLPCGLGSDAQMNNTCVDEAVTAPLATTLSPPSPKIKDNPRPTFASIIGLAVLIVVCGAAITVYLLNSRRRERLRSCCRTMWFRRPDVQMQYSRINTVEETDALLNAPETHCQSDSDDDLLSFDSLT